MKSTSTQTRAVQFALSLCPLRTLRRPNVAQLASAEHVSKQFLSKQVVVVLYVLLDLQLFRLGQLSQKRFLPLHQPPKPLLTSQKPRRRVQLLMEVSCFKRVK